MQNPFATIEDWLRRIDANQAELLKRLNTQQPALPETGGIELAQEITRLSKARIYALVSARILPVAKRGNKLYFDRAELIQWVKAGSRKVVTDNSLRNGQ